jgi:hypothetical protein
MHAAVARSPAVTGKRAHDRSVGAQYYPRLMARAELDEQT